MLLTADKILKKEIHSIKDFAGILNISLTAVYSAIANEHIDYTTIGTTKFIVMTKLTKEYKPNKSPRRVKPKKKKTGKK